MVVMYSFCGYFSVRLGSMMVAITSMFQSIAAIMLFMVWLDKSNETSEQLNFWLTNNDFIFATGLFREFENHTVEYIKFGIGFIAVHACSCFLMIFGAYSMSISLIMPFLVLELTRLLILSTTHIVGMMIVKRNILDIGFLIMCTLAGGFTLLLLYYKWFCVVSLCQCIRELQRPKSTESMERIMSNGYSGMYKSSTINVGLGNAQPLFTTPFGYDGRNKNIENSNGLRNLSNMNINRITRSNNNINMFGRMENNLNYNNEFAGNLVRPTF